MKIQLFNVLKLFINYGKVPSSPPQKKRISNDLWKIWIFKSNLRSGYKQKHYNLFENILSKYFHFLLLNIDISICWKIYIAHSSTTIDHQKHHRLLVTIWLLEFKMLLIVSQERKLRQLYFLVRDGLNAACANVPILYVLVYLVILLLIFETNVTFSIHIYSI